MKGEGVTKSAGRALITGASGGIGRELAKAFAEKGFDVVLLARDLDALNALAREIIATYGVNASVLPADLARFDAAPAIFEALEGEGVIIDVLVNNAGVITEGDFADIGLESQLRLLQINIVALTALTRMFLPAMKCRGKGRVLNVASIGAFMPLPKLATYGAAKAYVLSFTEALAEELRGSGVTITALCPGLTDTSMLRGSKFAEAIPDMWVMSAREAAARGCAACLEGEVVAVPGLANLALTSGSQLLPRALVRAIGGTINVGRWGRLARALLTRARRSASASPSRTRAS